MSWELSAADGQLRSALDRYARFCSSARDACLGGGRVNNTSELLVNLEKQSNNIASYIRTLEEARASIQRARSNALEIKSGNQLPVEILIHIFGLIPSGGSCLVQRDSQGQISGIEYPLYPDSLAHVCSSWRRVAITCPSLWTHIDIALDHSLNPGLFDRAKTYAIRAGNLPLEIHISDPGSKRERNRGLAIKSGKLAHENPLYNLDYGWSDLHDFEFLASNTAPIKSLELDLKLDHRYREIYYSVLEYFLAHCKPGVLAQYSVRCAGDELVGPTPFIEPVDTPRSLDGALLAVSSDHLEELWLHIPVLRVSGLCPHWSSRAYHRLVELYIGSTIPSMTRLQFVDILKASPKLQVLHLEAVLDELEDDENIDPVYLEDLRDLKVMTRDDKNYTGAVVLLWINPGKAHLRMSHLRMAWGEVWNFFERANISHFYLIGWSPYRLCRLLKKSSRLETLVLNAYDFDVHGLSCLLLPGASSDSVKVGETLPTTRINTLYLLWFIQFSFEEIQATVERFSVQRLLIYGGHLSYQADEGEVICKNTRNIKVKLSSIATCPTIEYYPDANLIHQHCDDWLANALLS